MGGRILPEFEDQKTAKYINTPETPLFSKSNQLYGLDLARDTISRTKQNPPCHRDGGLYRLCDCPPIRISTNPSRSSVPPLASVTYDLLESLCRPRYACTRWRCQAGKKRANEILNLFIAGQLDLRVLTLPDGLDPCDFLLQRGADAFREQLERCPGCPGPQIAMLPRRACKWTAVRTKPIGPWRKSSPRWPKRPPLRTGGQIETKLREDQFLARLAREFHVPEETVRGRIGSTAENSVRRFATQRGGDPPNAPLRYQRSVGARASRNPPSRTGGNFSSCRIDWARSIEQIPCVGRFLATFASCPTAGESPDFGRLVLEFDDPAMKNLLVQLDEGGRDRGGSDLAEQLPDLLLSFQLRNEKRNHQQTTAALKEKRVR